MERTVREDVARLNPVHADIKRTIRDMRRIIDTSAIRSIDRDLMHDYTDQLETLTRAYGDVIPSEAFPGIRFTPLELRLMTLLASRPNVAFPRTTIMDALYFDRPEKEPEIKIVDIYAHHIRKKLKKANSPFWLQCDWGVGYKLVKLVAGEDRLIRGDDFDRMTAAA